MRKDDLIKAIGKRLAYARRKARSTHPVQAAAARNTSGAEEAVEVSKYDVGGPSASKGDDKLGRSELGGRGYRLRGGRILRGDSPVGLLLISGPVVWCRVHPGLCEPGRSPRRTERTRRADRDKRGRA